MTMITRAVTTTEPCGRCGADATVYTRQAIHPYGEDLLWSQGMRCEACGQAWESDSRGFMPEPYRAKILAESGTWHAAITSLESSERVHAVLVLKKSLEISRGAAFQLVKLTPHAVFTGTDIEAEWVCRNLRVRGVQCAVEPATDAG